MPTPEQIASQMPEPDPVPDTAPRVLTVRDVVRALQSFDPNMRVCIAVGDRPNWLTEVARGAYDGEDSMYRVEPDPDEMAEYGLVPCVRME